MGRTRVREFSAILTSIAVRNSKIPGSKMEQAHERDLINNANKAVHSAKDPLDKLRQHCLARGVKGIVSLGRTFRIFDDDRSRTLDLEELQEGLKDYGAEMSEEETQQLFARSTKTAPAKSTL